MPTSVMAPFYEKFTVRLSMRKTQMNLPNSGCASETIWTNWNSIQWDKVARAVKSLQTRIVKAVKAKHFHKAKALLLLLTRSFYGKLLAILRVTTNKGSRTCGVDKILWNTPQRKWKAPPAIIVAVVQPLLPIFLTLVCQNHVGVRLLGQAIS